mgnify:CR=1 FL=1
MTKGKMGNEGGVNVHMRGKPKPQRKPANNALTAKHVKALTFNASPSAVTTSLFSWEELQSSLVIAGSFAAMCSLINLSLLRFGVESTCETQRQETRKCAAASKTCNAAAISSV